MGLQTGSQLANIKRPIIDPTNLRIAAYEIEGPLIEQTPAFIRLEDVREISNLGMIVDSSDEFVLLGDVIKLDAIYNLGFELGGMPVVDEKNHKLGKVVDYTLDTSGFVVQQLTVKRPLLRSLNDTELLIHRAQIIEINNHAIVVHSAAKAPEPELQEVVGSYVNPFRKSNAAPESIETNES